MYNFSRRNLAELWAKAQEKSGQRVPHLDEKCVSAELYDLYQVLRECDYAKDKLPQEVKAAVDRYYDRMKSFEKEWGKIIKEQEKLTCQKCRRYFIQGKGVSLVCPECGITK